MAAQHVTDNGHADVPPDIVRGQLAKILRSQVFTHASALSRLLEYLVDHTLRGNVSELKEYAVGVDVFNRGDAFDPRTDTIVRVQARRLRLKLAEYYERDGQGDAIVIELHKGHYAVSWRIAQLPAEELPAITAGLPVRMAAAADESQAETGPPSIVVLPFANLTGDADDEYLADGLTEEIISTLASVPRLRVVARTSAFQFKGRNEDIRKIGRELGVQTALEGSVRKDRRRIRVTAQLIDMADGFHLWSHIYEGALPGVFKLQEDTTRAIVEALRIRLSAGEQERLRRQQPASVEAYELYLKGLYFFNKATPADLETSIQYMESALALDPQFAAAYAGMAETYALWSTLGDRPAPQLWQQARAAAQHALELEDLAEAHAAMGTVLALDWQWQAAEDEFRRALALKPSISYARMAYTAGCLCPLRRYGEAIDQMRLTVTLDPVSAFARTILGQTLALAGRTAEAVDELHRALQLDPAFVFARYTLSFAYLNTSSHAEAIAAVQPVQHLAAQIPNCAGHLGYAQACLGNRGEAERLLQLLLDHSQGAWAPWIDIAAIHSGLGNTTEAMDWLERGYQNRCFDVLFIRDDPRFVNLRGTARFKRLAAQLAAAATPP
jgi:serine/threonine-protein kinase